MVSLYWKIYDGPFMPEDPFPVGSAYIEDILDTPLPEWCPARWKEKYQAVRISPEVSFFWTRIDSPLPLIASKDIDPKHGPSTIFVPAYAGTIFPERIHQVLQKLRSAGSDDRIADLWILLCAGRVVGEIVEEGQPGLLFGPAHPLYSWPALDWLDWYERLVE
jgi:hypothetical protein